MRTLVARLFVIWSKMRSKDVCLWWILSRSLHVVQAGNSSHGNQPQPTCPVMHFSPLDGYSDTCLLHQHSESIGELNLIKKNGWSRSDACQDLGSTKLCSFTNPSFNNGFGLSLITTADVLEELLSSSPAFTHWETKRPWRQAAPSYRDEAIPGKGVGLVANRRITAGELILTQTPAVLLDDRGFENLGERALKQLLVQAITALPQPHQSQYLNLSTHSDVEQHDDKVYQIFGKNNYRTRITNTTDFHATFIDVSRLNHDCRPNCGYQFDTTTLSQKVFAARDILPGEELTVSYIDPIQPWEERQAQLQSSWGFTCTCKHCTAESDDRTESDRIMKRIHSLWKELDDYTPASHASPEKAEELISLYELEGLKTRIHEAYYRAAVEWSGAGDSTKAVRYAMLSILRGQLMAGSDRPFVANMRELVKDPEKHWTWKFRLREEAKDEL